jgi:hypothetical protein
MNPKITSFGHWGAPQDLAEDGERSLRLLPHIPKQFDRTRPVSGVVIVGVGVDLEIPRYESPE